jgi:hypothetical protein
MTFMSTLPTPPQLLASCTSRVGGTAAFDNDVAVLAALDMACRLPGDELMDCGIGVRNLQGELYRRVALKGVAQILFFVGQMTALGFVAEPEESEHDGSGFDIIFRDRKKSATELPERSPPALDLAG